MKQRGLRSSWVPWRASRPGCGPCACDVFRGVDANTITTPSGAPLANTFAERWVRSIRHELLDRTLVRNQPQLRRLLDDYVQHHTTHRWSDVTEWAEQMGRWDNIAEVPLDPVHGRFLSNPADRSTSSATTSASARRAGVAAASATANAVAGTARDAEPSGKSALEPGR
jgi:hypothetical protein